MDGSRFDLLTRRLSQTTSRRVTFQSLAAGLVATATGAAGLESVGAVDAERCVNVGNSCKSRRGKKKKKNCCGSAKCRGGRCKCTGNKKQCGNDCITKNQCCNNGDCPTGEVCNNKNQCEAKTCANDGQCGGSGSDVACTCEGYPDAGVCQSKSWSQNFSKNLKGWYVTEPETFNFLPPTTAGTMRLGGQGRAIIAQGTFDPDDEHTARTNWGGYSRIFPDGGFTTEVEIFLDASETVPNGTMFSWDVGVNDPVSCEQREQDSEFMMNYGRSEDGTQFCVSGRARGAALNPCDPGTVPDPYIVEESGFHTFRHEFAEVGGELQVTMTVLRNGTAQKSWVVDTNHPIATVGGNRFGWFPRQQFEELVITNSKRVNG